MIPENGQIAQFTHNRDPTKESASAQRDLPYVVVGIPAFNVEDTIEPIIAEAEEICGDIIVCDDGSTDNTADVAERNGCKVIRHPRNRGYGAALKSIFAAARGMGADVLVTLDGDGQHKVKELRSLIEPILQGDAELVIGSRFTDDGADHSEAPRLRRAAIRAITKFTRLISGQRITDAQCGFRAYSREALSVLNPGEQGMGASTELLLLAKEHGLRIREMPATVTYNGNGRRTSTLNPIYHFTDVVGSTVKVASIKHPMLTYGIPGIILLGIGSLFGFWALQLYSVEGRLVTNLALIAIGAGIVGIILFITGLLLFVLITVIRERDI